ncbi:hypothetical protein [uncultured Acidaminococcus sp.]|uniref:hypothetical protein n=1 Tax=uncultured Acidaminococcus sp. TaxID=352152 RepID=UPI002942AC38|nr:hypothetical protein [uncultured Acidaminococcus sp.]
MKKFTPPGHWSLVTSHWKKEGSRAAAAFHRMMLAQTRLWLVLAYPEEIKTSNGVKERQIPVFLFGRTRQPRVLSIGQ